MWNMTTCKFKLIKSRLGHETCNNVPKIIFCPNIVGEHQKKFRVSPKKKVGRVSENNYFFMPYLSSHVNCVHNITMPSGFLPRKSK